ncbi:MAG: hypothetical protein KDJ12_06240, partial [Hyphomicrobiales bacterium]|nr:hypothetical protein [Hyphomicrobiales bacterium]
MDYSKEIQKGHFDILKVSHPCSTLSNKDRLPQGRLSYCCVASGRLSSGAVTRAIAPTSTTTVYVHDLADHIIAELNA